jgi:glycosyltransferase involved in cell wall biosynthesis
VLLRYGRFSARSPFSILKTIVQLTRDIANENFDILHINTAYDRKAILRDYLFLKVLRKRFSNAVFLKFHGTDSNVYQKRFFKVLTRQFLAYVDGIGFLSNDELIDFQQNFKRTTNFSVIKNSTPSNQNIHKGDNQRFNALFVGRVMASKGICDVVQAFIDIDQDNIRLNVLGNGALCDRLSRSNRNPRITFHGYLPEIEVLKFYRDCDVLVLPTYHQEGLPNVILKALSFGKPIITTKIRGMKDYLTDENCIFVAPHSPNEIKSAICKLYQDPKLRERMSFSNLQLSAIFKPSVVAKEYEIIYRNLIAK